MSRLSVTSALAPQGPRSVEIVVNRGTNGTSRSFMAEKGREGCVQEQDCLSYRYQVVITNSPRTRCRNVVVCFCALGRRRVVF